MKFNFNPVEPVRVTSKFGPRNTGIKGASTDHKGVDLGANRALRETPVILTNEAVLVTNAWNKYRGWYCVFKIDNTYSVLYQHLKEKCKLKLNQKYEPGTVVGIMGASRDTKAIPNMSVHLHFEVHQNGVPINPAPYINNLEEYEMVTETKILVNGQQKTVRRILKDGENFIRLRDFDDVLGIAKVSYDEKKKLPVVQK